MGAFATPTPIFVDLRQSKTWWPTSRPQRFYWVAVDGGNGRRLARASETYTNAGDAIDAARGLFGPGRAVLLRRPERGNEILREGEPDA